MAVGRDDDTAAPAPPRPEEADEDFDEDFEDEGEKSSSSIATAVKLLAASAFLCSAASTYYTHAGNGGAPAGSSSGSATHLGATSQNHDHGRRLAAAGAEGVPSYIGPLMDDLSARKKLFEDTPPEEVKYWFEYTGPLQKYFYRYSKSRGKADSFEGRDDSGVVSSRFVDRAGGGAEFSEFFSGTDVPASEAEAHSRLLDNCLAMGAAARPDTGKGTQWHSWFGGAKETGDAAAEDRCRVLFTLNTVGAGRGPTMLWETKPPKIFAANEPRPWMSEQETAATHLERNLREIDAMCATGQIAARVQVLVCEPIPGAWTDWMDSMLPTCGGQPAPLDQKKEDGLASNAYEGGMDVEDRPSPVQVVVVASASTADTCHDLKSGFMEKRMQDLVLAPPYLSGEKKGNLKGEKFDPAIKTTHPDLVSSDDHDVYVAMKWSTLVTVRGISAFLQASADLAAAAASPNNSKPADPEKDADGVTVALTNAPSSPFLVPSFVRVSYVSEENNKVAKWRMHGDFFHPAAWEICKDSFDMAWIPDSLSGPGGVSGLCYDDKGEATKTSRKLKDLGEECGQWWVYMAEEQMPTTPEVYANEVTAPLVQGGSNFIWMLTERQRQEIVKHKVCEHEAGEDDAAKKKCGESAQAVIPLGDLESFLMNFTPNTALGKKHNTGRTPGYSRQKEHEADRERVRERKQLKGQEDIEKALFDYTIYPAALFHKDATVKAARARDAVLTKKADREKEGVIGPQTVKSSYYDVTITKPREATSGWCQAISRKGLCALYADYFRSFEDQRCIEACGMRKNWSQIQK